MKSVTVIVVAQNSQNLIDMECSYPCILECFILNTRNRVRGAPSYVSDMNENITKKVKYIQ